jgi:hypothetical protein
MADFDSEHMLIQWGGKLPGNEQWSCSIRLGEQTVDPIAGHVMPSESDIQTWLDGSIQAAVLAYHSRAATHIHPQGRLSFVKANVIQVNGRYRYPVTHEHVFADVPGGGYAISPLPNQCTLCVSLTTDANRGPAHRGRFYLPAPSINIVPATGLATLAEVVEVRGSTKTFLEALADVPGVDTPFSLEPMVYSRKAGAATHRPVKGVDVGQVVDTQRRRRRSLIEGYQHVDVDFGVF